MDRGKEDFIKAVVDNQIFRFEDTELLETISPYYVDLRSISSYPHLLKYAADQILEHLLSERGNFDHLIAVETASMIPAGGVTYASIRPNVIPIPTGYLRRKQKDNKNPWHQVEGHFKFGDRAIIFDDLTIDYAASADFVTDTANAGLNVVGYAVIFEKMNKEKGAGEFTRRGMDFFSIFTYKDLVDVLKRNPELYKGSDFRDRVDRIVAFAEA